MIPYIGITDFAARNQSFAMADLFTRVSRGFDFNRRKLMVGVMMSYKTLNNLPTKWATAWVPKEEVADLFVRHPAVLNTLHYADYNGVDVYNNLCRATQYGGREMHALQLDMVWPDPEAVRRYRDRNPNIRIVLQVNAVALDLVDNRPSGVIQKLVEYGPALDYVLLDKSMGQGLGMNTKALRPFIQAILGSELSCGIAVAGGLGPNTLHLVEPLVEEFPTLSIDAQGKLRPSGNALDPIDWPMAADYLVKAVNLFEER
jgi:hypothetical protein